MENSTDAVRHDFMYPSTCKCRMCRESRCERIPTEGKNLTCDLFNDCDEVEMKVGVPKPHKTGIGIDGPPPKASAFDRQVGGGYYKQYQIQPFEFFFKNKITHEKAAIIRRILRYDQPGGKGLQDLKKIMHECELLIELNGYQDGPKASTHEWDGVYTERRGKE